MTVDRTSRIMAWDCTPGVFHWHYKEEDEVIYIVSGEVFISAGDTPERRLGPGDMALFPAGTSCTWRVTERVHKVAVLRKHVPRWICLGVRIWHRVLRTIGRAGVNPMAPARQPIT
jgi:mannose-6-phosphate isomerase-like protein (cupin superfamily)